MRWYAVLAALTLTVGCDSNEPNEDVPELGRYLLTFEAQRPGELSAFMVLTYADPDSLAGHWESEDVDRELSLGFWNVDGWIVGATYTDFAGFFTFRLRPDPFRCISGRFNDGDVSQAVFCELSRVQE